MVSLTLICHDNVTCNIIEEMIEKNGGRGRPRHS